MQAYDRCLKHDTKVGIFSSITVPSTTFSSSAAFSAQENQPFLNILHGNLQMSNIFSHTKQQLTLSKNTHITDILHIHIYYGLFQYSCKFTSSFFLSRDVAWDREILPLRVNCKKFEQGCRWKGELRLYKVNLCVPFAVLIILLQEQIDR